MDKNMIGELANLYIIGLSLAAILFVIVLYSRFNDSRPLAKIRVRTDDRYRRGNLPPEENQVSQPRDLVVGLLFVLAVLAGMIALLSRL
jgi:hypothetical protein